MPEAPATLDFTLHPGDDAWTVRGASPRQAPRTVPNPFGDRSFRGTLAELREWSRKPVRRGDPQAPGTEELLRRLSRQMGSRLEALLFSEEVRSALLPRAGAGGARLTLRALGRGELADRALALPWELIASGLPGPGLQVVREAVAEGAPELPEPAGPLSVAAVIAAPEDRSPMPYEEEALRLQMALAPLGHRALLAELGQIQDLVEVAESAEAHVLHLSGHGQDGQVLFENELGFAEGVPPEELVRHLRLVLLDPARRGRFPAIFFLSSRGRVVAGPAPEPSDLEAGPAVAARLHRAGFAAVVGYFGPLDGELASRAEETFYGALARGETPLAAAAAARATLTRPLGEPGGERWYPLGGSLLTFYLRGPSRPLASASREKAANAPASRRVVEVGGLPVLERGFIGRRGLQHELLRRIRLHGQRALVLQGLGGLGKTALATHLLARSLAPGPADRLVLRCRELAGNEDPIAELRAQAEEHGRLHGLPRWDDRVRELREGVPEPVAGFCAVLRLLHRERPGLTVYIDNAEALQIGPDEGDPEDLGSWRPGLEAWWREMERFAEEEGCLVLTTTRYAWEGLSTRAHVALTPLAKADSLRLVDTFPALGNLPLDVRLRLAERVDGHPRTVEWLGHLIALRREEVPETDRPWAEWVAPVLPAQEGEIRQDLLLDALWNRLPEEARDHARLLSILRQPAPAPVITRLGPARDLLIRASLLTRFREMVAGGPRIAWADRWGLHSLVRERVCRGWDEPSREAAHRAAGEAWVEWLQGSGWLRSDQREAVFHLLRVREADRAWPFVQDHVYWLRTYGRPRDANLLLDEAVQAGLAGDPLALARILKVNLGTLLNDPGVEALGQQVLLSQTSDVRKAEALFELAVFLDSQGRFSEAEAAVRRALETKEQHLDVPDYELGVTRVLLGRVLESLGCLAEAEEELRQALPVIERAPESIRPQFAVALHSLGAGPRQTGTLGGVRSPVPGSRGSRPPAPRGRRPSIRRLAPVAGLDPRSARQGRRSRGPAPQGAGDPGPNVRPRPPGNRRHPTRAGPRTPPERPARRGGGPVPGSRRDRRPNPSRRTSGTQPRAQRPGRRTRPQGAPRRGRAPLPRSRGPSGKRPARGSLPASSPPWPTWRAPWWNRAGRRKPSP
jgi:tetratricopeptide (TPR) repeat protein